MGVYFKDFLESRANNYVEPNVGVNNQMSSLLVSLPWAKVKK